MSVNDAEKAVAEACDHDMFTVYVNYSDTSASDVSQGGTTPENVSHIDTPTADVSHIDTTMSKFDENLAPFEFGNISSLNMSSENELSKVSGNSVLSEPRLQALACESAAVGNSPAPVDTYSIMQGSVDLELIDNDQLLVTSTTSADDVTEQPTSNAEATTTEPDMNENSNGSAASNDEGCPNYSNRPNLTSSRSNLSIARTDHHVTAANTTAAVPAHTYIHDGSQRCDVSKQDH